jgi:hypothetical protein
LSAGVAAWEASVTCAAAAEEWDTFIDEALDLLNQVMTEMGLHQPLLWALPDAWLQEHRNLSSLVNGTVLTVIRVLEGGYVEAIGCIGSLRA